MATRNGFLSTEQRTAWVMLMPALLVLAVLTIYPLVWAVQMAFQNVNFFNPTAASWVGLENFRTLIFDDDTFWRSIRITAIWCMVTVPCQAVLAMVIAMLLNTETRFAGPLRTLIIIPVFISPTAMGLIWRFMFEPVGGVANFVLTSFGLSRSLWHTSVESALIAVMVADIWQWTPFLALIFLAGLQSVPSEISEAAQLDGLNFPQYIFRIALPLMWPVALIALLIRIADSIRSFDLIYVITRGGPGSATLVASVNAYLTFQSGRLGLVAAYGFIIVVVIYLVVALLIRIMAGRLAAAPAAGTER